MTELHNAGTALVASQLGIPHTSQYNTYQVGTAENNAYAAATESVGVGQSHTTHRMNHPPTGGHIQAPQAHPAHLADFHNGTRE
jgi:hypothetical protein